MNLSLLSAAFLSSVSLQALPVETAPPAPLPAAPAGEGEPVEPVAPALLQDAPVPPVAGTLAEPGAQAPPEEEPAPEGAQENTIVVTGEAVAPPGDPLANINATAFEITQSVDRAVVGPVAKVYRDDFPKPLRNSLKNFFRNLFEPVAFLNYLLQLKPGKAFETLGRFAVNTTIGVAGLFDMAKKKPFNLPYRRNGFANTLGYYGVGPGPYLVLPLVGATTLRDFLGGLADVSVLPIAVGKPFSSLKYSIPAYTINALEFRIEFDEKLEAINATEDPYTAMRQLYLCQREADIAALKNRPPAQDCSPGALFADPPEADAAVPEEVEPQPGIDTALQADPVALPAEPEPPAIIYVSNPVVQPIPQN